MSVYMNMSGGSMARLVLLSLLVLLVGSCMSVEDLEKDLLQLDPAKSSSTGAANDVFVLPGDTTIFDEMLEDKKTPSAPATANGNSSISAPASKEVPTASSPVPTGGVPSAASPAVVPSSSGTTSSAPPVVGTPAPGASGAKPTDSPVARPVTKDDVIAYMQANPHVTLGYLRANPQVVADLIDQSVLPQILKKFNVPAILEREKRVVETKTIYLPVDAFKALVAPGPGASSDDPVKNSYESSFVLPQDWDGGLMYLDFSENQKFKIVCMRNNITHVYLEPGENLLSKDQSLIITDKQGWEIGSAPGRENGIESQRIFIRPLGDDRSANLIITTDRRTYHLQLTTSRTAAMQSVKFRYPAYQAPAAKAAAGAQQPTTSSAGPSVAAPSTRSSTSTIPSASASTAGVAELRERLNTNGAPVQTNRSPSAIEVLGNRSTAYDPTELVRQLRFDYEILVPEGSAYSWKPFRVMDDGARVYVYLDPKAFYSGSFPAPFNENNSVLNWRTFENVLIIDSLFERATLRSHDGVVVIRKKNSEVLGL